MALFGVNSVGGLFLLGFAGLVWALVVLAQSLALPDLVGALDGGHPPLPCRLNYLGCPSVSSADIRTLDLFGFWRQLHKSAARDQ